MKEVKEEIEVLPSNEETDAVDILKKEEAHLKTLVVQLGLSSNENSHTLNIFEHELTLAEKRLKKQIKEDRAHDTKTTSAAIAA